MMKSANAQDVFATVKKSPLKCVAGRDRTDFSEGDLVHPNLQDQSELPRFGVKGKDVLTWLSDQGIDEQQEINAGKEIKQGGWVLRLGTDEYWVLSNPTTKQPTFSENTLNGACYPVYCEYSRAWFVLSGCEKAEVMAKVCGVDLREEAFPVDAIVQTSLARVNAVIFHHRFQGDTVFSILSDAASARYLWESLSDACSNTPSIESN